MVLAPENGGFANSAPHLFDSFNSLRVQFFIGKNCFKKLEKYFSFKESLEIFLLKGMTLRARKFFFLNFFLIKFSWIFFPVKKWHLFWKKKSIKFIKKWFWRVWNHLNFLGPSGFPKYLFFCLFSKIWEFLKDFQKKFSTVFFFIKFIKLFKEGLSNAIYSI